MTHIEATPENIALVALITGPVREDYANVYMDDGSLRRINGRHIVGNMPRIAPNGEPIWRADRTGVHTHRVRLRIPKHHPWRGKRP